MHTGGICDWPSGSRVFLFPRTGNARVANTRRGYAPSPCSQPEARGGERQRARREPAWDGDGGMSAPSSGPFYPLLFTFNAMEVENSEPRPAGEGDVTRTATLRRWSTRLRPKLRELALAVADIAKAISLTLVSKEWGGATLSADKKVIRHHFREKRNTKYELWRFRAYNSLIHGKLDKTPHVRSHIC